MAATRRGIRRRGAAPRRPAGGRGRRPGRKAVAPREAGDPVAGLRIGCGFDVHPLALGRRLVLGGVTLQHTHGLIGHSDADVLTHAICDAILGALGQPDMGRRFPSSDPALRGRSSLLFLREVAETMRADGFTLLNLDAVIAAEAPPLAPHLARMRDAVAGALGCDPAAVGIKAKRCEGIGAIGRREGMLAQAVALLRRASGAR
jgi:2-C-methyl-D-erythritol 2,4-cyclodiphosphate synthase